MMYLEFLRVRRVFVWYAAACIAIAAFSLVGVLVGSGTHFDLNDTGPHGSHEVHIHGLASLGVLSIPVVSFAGLAALGALVIATALAASFNRETHYAHFTWVRPLSRVRMAAEIAAVDVLAIVGTAAFTWILGMLTVSGSLGAHAHYVGDMQTIEISILGLGTAVMWYAVLQAASAWTPGKGGPLVGITATVLGFALPLSYATFLGPIVYVFRALLYIDPLAYFTSVTASGSDVTAAATIGASLAVRAVLVWVLAAAALALASFEWTRVEI